MTKLKIYPIGSKVFLVHKQYKDKKLNGGKIIPCKVKTYENVNGKILPVCSIIGDSRKTIMEDSYYLFDNVNDAIEAISPEPISIEKIEINPIKPIPQIARKEKYKVAAMQSLISSNKEFDEKFISNIATYSEMIANEMIKREKL